MELLKAVFASAFLLIASPAAFAYPGDLDLDSFTDEHPEGVNQEQKKLEEEKKADEKQANEQAANPERTLTDTPKTSEELLALEEPLIKPEDFLCNSSTEYIRTIQFLRKTQVILVTEQTARKIADLVSKSCDGGADRFAKILVMLKTVGLSDKAAVKMGLQFAARSPDVQKNFLEIFTHSFLAEFFDYDYPTAVALAFELSKNYKGNPAQVRDDFIELVRFCKDGKKLDLPSRLCAEFTIKVARLSQFYPQGVRTSFYKLYQRFREDKEFGIDIQTALRTTYGILKNGPRAADNFFQGYDFAIADKGLAMTQGQALKFGLKMAARSYRGVEPPIFNEQPLRNKLQPSGKPPVDPAPQGPVIQRSLSSDPTR
jgi:hypothetical protein